MLPSCLAWVWALLALPVVQGAQSDVVLRGRVLGRSGAPAAGLALRVERAIRPEASATITTDADGAFELHGVKRQAYVVRARTEASGDYPHRLTPDAIWPQASPAEPEHRLVFSRPHLVLRLRDGEGRPWGGPALYDRGNEYPGAYWPRAPRSFVHERLATRPGSFLAGRRRAGTSVLPGEIVYEVTAGEGYLVGAFGEGVATDVRVVEVPAEAERIEIDLVAQEVEVPATLLVRVWQDGRELATTSDGSCFVVELESLSGSVVLVATGSHAERSPFQLRAAPGTYRVVARGYASVEPYHGGLTRARDLGRAEVEVVLAPGATHELKLDLDAGGRLELTLEGAGNEGEFERLPGMPGMPPTPYGVDLLLVGPTGAAEPIQRRCYLLAETVTSLWALGETQLSECLPTGPWTVLGRLKSGREVRVEVEIREGETTRAKLSF